MVSNRFDVLGSETEPFSPRWGIFWVLTVPELGTAIVDFIGVVSDVWIIRLEPDNLLTVGNYVPERVKAIVYQIPLILGVVHLFGSHASNLPPLCIRCKCILLLENNY
jgi:hypothetical protein